MFDLFKKQYTDEELLTALRKDGVCKNQHLIQRARENDPEIVSRFAWYYFNQNRRSKKAFAWFNKGATHNHNEAQYQVGYMYKKGLGVNQDNKLAMEWYKKAASNGHNKAQYKIGKMYRYGDGTYRNYKQAEEWYKKAANNGNVDAMYDLGYLYRYGATLVHKDIHSAIKWYTKAAEHEHVVAQYHLGEIYELDKEVKNLQMAINWYHKARFLNPHVKSKIRTLNKQGYYPRGEQKDDKQEKQIKYRSSSEFNRGEAAVAKAILGFETLGRMSYTT